MDVRRRLVSEISSSKHLYIFTQLSTTFTPITNFLQYSYWCGLMLDGYLLSPKLVITILQLRSKAPLLSNILCSTTAHARHFQNIFMGWPYVLLSRATIFSSLL